MLTPYLPYPPASGGQIRTLYLLKYLAQNHSITLVSLYKDDREKKFAKNLQSYCAEIHLCKRPRKPWQVNNIAKAVFSNLPFLIVRNYSREAVETIEQLLKTKSFDVIHAETFYIMPHIPETHIPVLLVEQTIEYKVYQHFVGTLPFFLKYPLTLDIFKLKYWETYYWKKANLVATVSESDKKEIQHILPDLTTEIIPNGAGDEMIATRLKSPRNTSPQLLFVGNFYWLQNVEAARYLIDHVFPKLRNDVPGIRLVIAGQNAGTKITGNADEGIEIVDLAADDTTSVKRLYGEASVFIAPIFGPGGTRLKILAAMASGVPVISTHVGVEGLGIKNGEHVLIATNPKTFVAQTKRVIENQDLYKTIQKNAYQHVKRHFSWKSIAKKLEHEYEKIIRTAHYSA